MHSTTRKMFPLVALVVLIGLTCWALWFGAQAPADFTFNNGTEIESVDPARVTGSPEGRIIRALFEGLYRPDPETLEPRPAMAVSADPKDILSADGRTYTFSIRRDAVWTDGTPVTATDFRWSWQRLLHPEIASQYTFVLFQVVNAQKYATPTLLEAGDPVEIELPTRARPFQLFPRGAILEGTLKQIEKPPEPVLDEKMSSDEKDQAIADWREQWIFIVEVDGKLRRFAKNEHAEGIERCRQVLFDFDEVGIKTPDEHTLQVTLTSTTPYFLYLMQFYPTFPVNRKCVETHGYPNWTRPENIVGNGPFVMKYRRIRDRIRMVKNPGYWNAQNVKLNVVDALAIKSATTALNMYLDGQVDWIMSPPSPVIPDLQKRDDYLSQPSLSIYFYRINVTEKPFDEQETRTVDGESIVVDRGKLVRQALNQAINKKEICEKILRAGQQPARSMVPPGLTGYELAKCGDYDVENARRLLAEAGYPGGSGLPLIELLYNTSQGHQQIAETIGEYWQRNLGVKVKLRSLEWGSFLSTTQKMEYKIARAGWIGDYPDPNTFLDLFITGGPQNETGWSHKEYDHLIEAAQSEEDPQRRLQLLHDAEAILMDELPVIPIYSYVSVNLVKPTVKGFYSNAQDLHPLTDIYIDEQHSSAIQSDEGAR